MTTGPFIDLEEIRIDRFGRWLSNGAEITHAETVRAYSQHLGRDAEGYFVSIGKDFKRIRVEDTAFFVIDIDFPRAVRLTDGTRDVLDLSTLRYRDEPGGGRLTCRVKGGREEARFLTRPYYELLQKTKQDARGFYLEHSGRRYDLSGKA